MINVQNHVNVYKHNKKLNVLIDAIKSLRDIPQGFNHKPTNLQHFVRFSESLITSL